jgi:hypothetical protein
LTKLFLDSGAFSAYSNKTTVNLQDYIDFIYEHKDEIETYANLDDIGSPEKTWENQAEMERQGLRPIPVYHLNEPIKYRDKAMEYEYFAIGGLASAKGVSLTPFLDTVFQAVCPPEKDFYPTHKVHGFGIATPEILTKYPWYSIDSTSWVMYGRYGIILIPDTNYLKEFVFNKPPRAIAISSRSKAIGDKDHYDRLQGEKKDSIVRYCKSKGIPIGRSLTRRVEPGYILKEDEQWWGRVESIPEKNVEKGLDEKEYERTVSTRKVVKVVEVGLRNDGSLRDKLNLLYFLDLEKYQESWPWPWNWKEEHLLKKSDKTVIQ